MFNNLIEQKIHLKNIENNKSIQTKVNQLKIPNFIQIQCKKNSVDTRTSNPQFIEQIFNILYSFKKDCLMIRDFSKKKNTIDTKKSETILKINKQKNSNINKKTNLVLKEASQSQVDCRKVTQLNFTFDNQKPFLYHCKFQM